MEQKPKVSPVILTALFSNGVFHPLGDNTGGEFYIDLMDNLLKGDIEIVDLLNEDTFDSEKFNERLADIVEPYWKDARENLAGLDRDGWIKVGKIEFGKKVVGYDKKQKYKGDIIPAGPILANFIKISASSVNWDRFIDYIAEEELKEWYIDPEESFSPTMQEALLAAIFYKISRYLDKEEDIIFHTSYVYVSDDKELRRINVWKTMKRLNESKIISIVGVSPYKIIKSEDEEYITLKIKISLTRNLFEYIKAAKDSVAGIANKTKQVLSFNENEGLLAINGKTVKFRKFTEQYHALAFIFSKPDEVSEEWFFSELAELIDKEKGYTDKDFHNYFSAIKRKVSAETGIRDLFITTTQSVKINPKYLK